jgi:hypothetical protein
MIEPAGPWLHDRTRRASCHRRVLADVAWRASYDRHLAVKNDHVGFSSASSRFSVSPLGVRRTGPTQRARADSLCLIEAGRRRTRGVATQRRRRSGQTASPPTARPASSPRSEAPRQHSPRGVSPRCINDGTAPMQACKVQGAVSCQHLPHEHFCDGLHRRHHISKMSAWFSTAILLDEPATALATRRTLQPCVHHAAFALGRFSAGSSRDRFEVHKSRQRRTGIDRSRRFPSSPRYKYWRPLSANRRGEHRSRRQTGARLPCRSNSEWRTER